MWQWCSSHNFSFSFCTSAWSILCKYYSNPMHFSMENSTQSEYMTRSKPRCLVSLGAIPIPLAIFKKQYYLRASANVVDS